MTKKLSYDFYRPHKRVQYTGELVDKTGKRYRPLARTKQSMLAETDINNIIKSFTVTGQINHIARNAAAGVYMDLPDHMDFQQAQNLFLEAERAFMTIPAKVRDRFHNDPSEWLAWVGDPKNRDEATDLGFFNRKAPEPQSAPAAPPSTPPSTPPKE